MELLASSATLWPRARSDPHMTDEELISMERSGGLVRSLYRPSG